MLVETFEQTEVTSDMGVEVENKEECVELAKELELEGQIGLLSGNKEKPEICPYRKMKSEEVFVYEIICPESCNASEYNEGPIPLRVMQVLAHARSLEIFKEIKIWYAPNADIKDPVLVGQRMHNNGYTTERFILARWGDELAPMSELMPKALQKARATLKANLAEIYAKVKAKLDFIDDIPDHQFFGGKIKISPTYYD